MRAQERERERETHGRRALALAGLAMLIAMGCDPEAVLFIEPASRGETALVLVPPEGGQGADPERLESLATGAGLGGEMDAVRYRVTEHHQPFLLTGDLSEGIRDLTALQLPVPIGDPAEQLLSELPAPRPWQSLRVYDGGTCGVLVPWIGEDEGGPASEVPPFVPLLFKSIANQLEDDGSVEGVSIQDATLQPVLRSIVPRVPLTSPEPRDRLELAFEIQADHIGNGRAIGCDDVRMRLETTLELVPTDLAWVAVRKKGFPSACFGESMSKAELRDAIAAGRRCAPDAVVELPEPYGVVRGADIARLEWLADWTGQGGSKVLVGLQSIEGQPLGAHDLLVRTLASDVTSFRADRCIKRVRSRIKRDVREGLAAGFVTGLSAAFRDAITWDPAHLPGFEPDAGIEVLCETDRDCRDAFGGAGLRHRCLVRSPERYPEDLRDVVPDTPPGEEPPRICHFVSEPDRINVRPDGIQIAITGDDDLQVAAYSGTFEVLNAAFCDPNFPDTPTVRGLLVAAGSDAAMPRQHSLTAPFALDGVEADPPRASGGCSAASGAPGALPGLLLLGLLRRRRVGR